jgi:hypothetical protein
MLNVRSLRNHDDLASDKTINMDASLPLPGSSVMGIGPKAR